MQKVIPNDLELHGQIIDLRPAKESDYPLLQKIYSDPKTMEQLRYMAYLDQGGWILDQVKKRFQQFGAEQKEQKHLGFIAHVKASKEIAGSGGFKNIDLRHKHAEFGLILHHPFWGRGIATEFHLLCLDYAFKKIGLHRIEFVTFITNQRMRSFFDKVGIPLEGIRREDFFENEKFVDNAVYVLFDREWEGIKKKLQERLLKQRAK